MFHPDDIACRIGSNFRVYANRHTLVEMSTTIYDSSFLTKRKQSKTITNSFLTRIQGQPCQTGSAPFLGITVQSIINEVRTGNMPAYRKNDGGCTTKDQGCPCQPI